MKRLKGNAVRNEHRPVVLLCSHSAGEELFGGERSFLDVLDALWQLRFNVVVSVPGCSNPVYLQKLLDQSLAVYDLSYGWWKDNVDVDEAVVSRFSRIIAYENVNVVHSNTITLREPLIAAKRMEISRIIHVRELIRFDEALISMIGDTPDKITTYTWNNCDLMIANSYATARGFEVPGKTPEIVYNTIGFNEIGRIEHPSFQNTLRVGLISSNLEKKGLSDFVSLSLIMASANVDMEFILIGPCNHLTSDISRRIESGELPKSLKVLGYLSDPADAISEIDIILNLSHFQESFGRTVLEGMAAGRPAIVYGHGALTELVEDGITGIITRPLDINSVAAALVELNNDRGNLIRMGRASLAKANNEFTPAHFLDKMRSVYSKLNPYYLLHDGDIPERSIKGSSASCAALQKDHANHSENSGGRARFAFSLIEERISDLEKLVEVKNVENQSLREFIIEQQDKLNEEARLYTDFKKELEQKIFELKRSHSWRLTAPLRKARDIFRSLFSG